MVCKLENNSEQFKRDGNISDFFKVSANNLSFCFYNFLYSDLVPAKTKKKEISLFLIAFVVPLMHLKKLIKL